MPSPFPGMNPYLEQADAWVDFHFRLINVLAEQINERTGDAYFAKVEEQIYIHELPPDHWRALGRADIAVAGPTPAVAAGAFALAAPFRTELVEAIDEVSLPYIEVRSRAGRDVVTVVEVLSPSNKRPGVDREQYARKRLRLTNSRVNFVELDLLRGWPRHSFRRELPPCAYYAAVYRAAEWPYVGVWPVGLRERLPALDVPLHDGVPGVAIDLQAAVHLAYDRGKFVAYVYDGMPEPPLSDDDAAWAAPFVPSRA